MPEQNPITRLHEIQLGLSRLAEEFEKTTGEKAVNLTWWSGQLAEVIEQLKRSRGA